MAKPVKQFIVLMRECAIRALAAVRDRGMTSAQLGVDSENPFQALTLYERHRFETVRTGSGIRTRLNPKLNIWVSSPARMPM